MLKIDDRCNRERERESGKEINLNFLQILIEDFNFKYKNILAKPKLTPRHKAAKVEALGE